MKTKPTHEKLSASAVRLGSALVAAVTLAIFASSYAFAQAPHEVHHPDGAPKEAASPMELEQKAQAQPPSQMQGGMMGGMMQDGGMMGGGMMGMMGRCPMMGMMMGGGHVEGRAAFLKAELAITDEQKAVWEPFSAALKKSLASMQTMRETMRKVMQAKSPVERLDAHIAAMETRVAALKEVRPALASLYAALSEEQKKKADQLLSEMRCMGSMM